MRVWVVMLMVAAGAVGVFPVWAEELAVERIEASTGDILKLTISGERQIVAVWGANAPSALTEQGLAARRYVADFLKGADPRVELVKTKAGVRYVRVVVDGVVLNEALLRGGYARWDRTFSPDETAYGALEEEARLRGVGMWRKSDRIPPPLRIGISRDGASGSILIDGNGNKVLRAKGSVKPDPSVADAALLRAAEERALHRAQAEERARQQAEYAAMEADAARRSYDDALGRYSRELALRRQEGAMYGRRWYGYGPQVFRFYSFPSFTSHRVFFGTGHENREVPVAGGVLKQGIRLQQSG